MGRRHVELVQEYAARIGRVSKPLHDDCRRFRPVAGAYSPYGVLYGFSADLLKHMVLKASQPDAVNRFGLEDVFVAGDVDSGKLPWVNGWRKLPHLTPDVAKQFDYPQQFAEDVFDRIELALRGRVATTGRFFIRAAGHPQDDSRAPLIPDKIPLPGGRREGKFVVSYDTPDGWRGISKSILTESLGGGRDVTIVGLPPVAAQVVTLMCPGLVLVEER